MDGCLSQLTISVILLIEIYFYYYRSKHMRCLLLSVHPHSPFSYCLGLSYMCICCRPDHLKIIVLFFRSWGVVSKTYFNNIRNLHSTPSRWDHVRGCLLQNKVNNLKIVCLFYSPRCQLRTQISTFLQSAHSDWKFSLNPLGFYIKAEWKAIALILKHPIFSQ